MKTGSRSCGYFIIKIEIERKMFQWPTFSLARNFAFFRNSLPGTRCPVGIDPSGVRPVASMSPSSLSSVFPGRCRKKGSVGQDLASLPSLLWLKSLPLTFSGEFRQQCHGQIVHSQAFSFSHYSSWVTEA